MYVDLNKAIEYYDSYGRDPSKAFMKQVKLMVSNLEPDTYLKFKINRVKQQREDSDTCGYHAMLFLMDRFKGKPFKQCTGWSEVCKAEKRAAKVFGYI